MDDGPRGRAGGPVDVDDSFSVTYEVSGYSAQPRFRFFDVRSNQPLPTAQLPERSSTRASSSAAAAGGFNYGIPLEELKSMEVWGRELGQFSFPLSGGPPERSEGSSMSRETRFFAPLRMTSSGRYTESENCSDAHSDN